MTAADTTTLCTFPIVVETKCRNIDRIYPLKQKQVSAICEAAGHFPIVKRLIVFGSSVTAKCHIGSDLDLCIEADQDDGMKIFELQRVIGDICDWNCDIVMLANIGNRLRETIEREGVVIYE